MKQAYIINVFPDPTPDGILNITFTAKTNTCSVRIYNMEGLLMKEQKNIRIENSGLTIQLPPVKGTYFVEVAAGKNKLAKKVIFQ